MEIRTYPIGPLESNSYVVLFGKDALIVDPSVDYSSLHLESFQVRAIFCTHAHFDHITEAESIRAHTGAKIFCYTDELSAMFDPVQNRSSMFSQAIAIQPPVFPLIDGAVLRATDLGFVSSEEFVIKILHTPGHTFGSMCINLEVVADNKAQDYLFSGDTVFAGTIGRTDLGGNMQDMTASLRKIARLPDNTIVLPGHGPTTTVLAEKQYNPYFTALN